MNSITAPAEHSQNLSPLQLEVARLLVTALDLKGVAAGEIDPDAPLFGAGLGLDSLDALELALAVSKTYGFQLRSDDANNLNIFASLRSLSRHIETHRVR
ncbi:MAG: acyl carrier protein [Rhodospirillales bacterium]|nr:acyl carrier protein [Rhodospirillales bacterium]